MSLHIKDDGFGLKFDDEIIAEGIILNVEKELQSYPTEQIINDIENELKDYLIGFGREVESIVEEEKKGDRYTHYYISGENEYLKQAVRGCEINECF